MPQRVAPPGARVGVGSQDRVESPLSKLFNSYLPSSTSFNTGYTFPGPPSLARPASTNPSVKKRFTVFAVHEFPQEEIPGIEFEIRAGAGIAQDVVRLSSRSLLKGDLDRVKPLRLFLGQIHLFPQILPQIKRWLSLLLDIPFEISPEILAFPCQFGFALSAAFLCARYELAHRPRYFKRRRSTVDRPIRNTDDLQELSFLKSSRQV